MRNNKQNPRIRVITAATIEHMERRQLLSAVLTGTVIGTPGSYHNLGNTISKVFDGILTNYFDGPTADGNYAGLNLGTATGITSVGYAPRVSYASRMVGGVFQGSDNANFSNARTLYTVASAPANGVITKVNVNSDNAYRYVRYLSPAASYGDVGEVQFFSSPAGAVLDASGVLTVTGTAGADVITVNTQEIADTSALQVVVTVNSVMQTFDESAIKSVIVNAGDSLDHISAYTSEYPGETIPAPTTTINAGGGSDFVTVSQSGTVAVNGGDGDDQVFAYSTSDLQIKVDGGAGTNSYYDRVNHSYGNDVIDLNGPTIKNIQNYTFGSGQSTGDQGPADVTIVGTDGPDIISVFGANNVSLQGNGGDDTILVQSGSAFINAGTGNDSVTLQASEFSTVLGGDGNDTIDSSGSSSPITVNGGRGTDTAYTKSSDVVFNVEIINPVPIKLTGTVIGTSGSYKNNGNVKTNAFDGKLTTYFDGPDASGDWVGLDLGTPKAVRQVKFAPRAGFESRMREGEIQASNSADFSSGVVTLYTLNFTPKANTITTVQLNNTARYRYYRYVGPTNSSCNIAELEFDG